MTNPAVGRTKGKVALKIPPFFKAALKLHPKAAVAFGAFSNSHKKEYLEWVSGAKKAETRERRLQQALAMIAGGKARNRTHE